jgi:hypothetical protein
MSWTTPPQHTYRYREFLGMRFSTLVSHIGRRPPSWIFEAGPLRIQWGGRAFQWGGRP